MVAPIGLGALLDFWLDWGPWAMIAGAVLGLITGMMHLISFLNRKPMDSPNDESSQTGQPPKKDAGP
jgi:F0F1-type ATP synthase assembly protein I